MKPIVGIVILLLGIGCQNFWYDLALDTRRRIFKLSPGMSKQEVILIMGTDTPSLDVSKPHRSSMFNKNGDTIEIFFYYTEYIIGKSGDEEFTPLVFINGKLDSWGWESWIEKAKRYDINVNYKVN